MYGHNSYQVVLDYYGELPTFTTRVMARSEKSAENIAMADAVANGWPNDWSKVKEVVVTELNV